MLTADDVGRSLRGSAAFLNRRADGLDAFEISQAAFWRSFSAIVLTLPAYIVSLALAREALGLLGPGRTLFDDVALALVIGLGHLASFLALPLAMAFVIHRSELGPRYVPFVIVTNWVQAYASLALAIPGLLLLLGLETPQLTALFTLAVLAIALHTQWFATQAALGMSPQVTTAVTGLGLLLWSGCGGLLRWMELLTQA